MAGAEPIKQVELRVAPAAEKQARHISSRHIQPIPRSLRKEKPAVPANEGSWVSLLEVPDADCEQRKLS